MMVAARPHDLWGAQAVGFKTAFVARPLEYGQDGYTNDTPDPSFDVVASDFHDLARQLGV